MSIKIEKLNFYYSYRTKYAFHALKDLSCNIKDNSFTALIGETGSGKSTLIQHLNGLLIPTSGKLDIDTYIIDIENVYKKDGKINNHIMNKKRKNKFKDIKNLRKRVGVAFQFPEYQLFAENVLKDVMFGPLNFGYSNDEAKENAIEALKLLSIDESFYQRSPFELSGGEKRKVALAGILAFKPNILVLDEPTVGLDMKSKENFLSLLQELSNKGISIILSTHDMDIVLKYANYVILLEKGKIIKHTEPIKLFTDTNYQNNNKYNLPKAISTALYLNKNGYQLNLERIKDIDSLAKEIIRSIK